MRIFVGKTPVCHANFFLKSMMGRFGLPPALTESTPRVRAPVVRRLFSLALIGASVLFPSGSFADHPLTDQVRSVTTAWVKRVLDAGENLILIDLRPAPEFGKKRLPGAASVPMTELEKRFREVPRFGRVVLYCSCPQYDLIEKAIFLQKLGYRNIAVMPEGFARWLELGYPVEEIRP
jgi:rhodanese-related sulfurtransferase